MWKQSVWTSTISSHLATKHLKEGGLLTLAGAKAALAGTPGNFQCTHFQRMEFIGSNDPVGVSSLSLKVWM